jgi:biopolymer transport protein ExbD
MLKSASPLSQSALTSRLGDQSMIQPSSGGRGRRSMVAGLLLTSLVDAFSILVIFLIMNHSANQETVDMGKNIILPQSSAASLIQDGTTIRVEQGKFVVDGKEVTLPNLIATLKSINASAKDAKKEGLVIVADRNLDYAELSPVILAGSQSGFTKFKFAVVHKE